MANTRNPKYDCFREYIVFDSKNLHQLSPCQLAHTSKEHRKSSLNTVSHSSRFCNNSFLATHLQLLAKNPFLSSFHDFCDFTCFFSFVCLSLVLYTQGHILVLIRYFLEIALNCIYFKLCTHNSLSESESKN